MTDADTGCVPLTEYELLQQHVSKCLIDGDYDGAVLVLVACLRINPGDDNSRSLLAGAYSMAVKVHEGRIHQMDERRQWFMWDSIASEYCRLTELQQAISSLPHTSRPADLGMEAYAGRLDEANRNAAEVHYQMGKRLISDHVRAGDEFMIANRYVPGYKDALALAAEGYYQSGLRLSEMDDPVCREQAARDFKEADLIVPGYRDAISRYEDISRQITSFVEGD